MDVDSIFLVFQIEVLALIGWCWRAPSKLAYLLADGVGPRV
jgi:hypothetical protein